jgi:hypothetical protein
MFSGEVISWSTTSKPPSINMAITGIIADLASIDSEMNQDVLNTLINSLITTPPKISSSNTLKEALQNIANAEALGILNDVYHMIALVKAAFWIES